LLGSGAGLVGGVGLRRGARHATAVRPDPSTLGAVGAWEAHAASAARTSSQADEWKLLEDPDALREWAQSWGGAAAFALEQLSEQLAHDHVVVDLLGGDAFGL
jgi:hypothetical protein